MAEFMKLWEGGPVFAQAPHFKLSTDSVLLADFVNTASARRGIDLGCASGAISLLLLAKSEKLHMTGLELVEQAAGLFEENMAANSLEERSASVCGDIRQHRQLFRAGSFDLAVANPPYFSPRSGFVSPAEGRGSARSETDCSLEELCAAAAFLLRTGGSFSLVYRPERLAELFCAMSEAGLEPKRLRMVCHKASSAPSLVLVEGRRGAKPGLKAESSLILCNADGSESDEYRRIYRR